MAINAKVTYIFNFGRNGWSETWYQATSDNLDQVMILARQVATKRAALLAKGASLEAIRVSDEQVSGDSILETTPNKLATTEASTKDPDTAWNCWLGRATSGSLYRRSVWFRGAPDEWIIWDPTTLKFAPVPTFAKAVADFEAILVKNVFAIKALGKELAFSPITKISKIEEGVGGKYKITATAHGFVNTDSVRVYGVKGDNISDVNGVWEVFNATADTFEIPLNVSVGFLYKGGGKVRVRKYKYPQIDFLEYVRAAKRDTGRAFFVTRGRSAVRK